MSASPRPPLEALFHAIGEEVRQVKDPPVTRLVAPLEPGDVTASVESTLHFPAPCAAWIGGRRLTYTGTTDGSLTGLADPLPRLVTIPAGETVRLDVRAVPVGESDGLARLDMAWRDTLVHKASGAAFDKLAAFYGLERPYDWPEESWRDALHAVVYGPRGTPGSAFAFLEAALQHHATTLTVVVTKPAVPGDPVARQLGAVSPFAGHLVGRMVRLTGIAEGLYCVVGPPTATDGTSTTLELCPWTVGYWQGANWGKLAWPVGETEVEVTATFLPFTLREPTPGPDYYGDDGLTERKRIAAAKPYKDPPEALTGDDTAALATPYEDDDPDLACKVLVLLAEGVTSAPPTYLQPGELAQADGEEDLERPAGQPYGGHMIEAGLAEGTDGHVMVNGVDTGPHPIYLQGDSLLGVLEERLKVLLAAGVHVRTMQGA